MQLSVAQAGTVVPVDGAVTAAAATSVQSALSAYRRRPSLPKRTVVLVAQVPRVDAVATVRMGALAATGVRPKAARSTTRELCN
jgi:ApbE superfamily uncharacterized protein (UPF0280 family)